MDGEKNMAETRRSRLPLQTLTLLVMSVALVVCVGGLICLSLNTQHLCQQQRVPQIIDIEADVTVKSNNQEKVEKITYNRDYRVAYYTGEDGSFEVDDFGKGLHIIRAPGNKVCYVIPVGSKPASGDGFEQLLQQSASEGQIRVNRSLEVSFEVLPGEIGDTSFIPQGALDECTNGYRWMVMTTSNDELREKRQAGEEEEEEEEGEQEGEEGEEEEGEEEEGEEEEGEEGEEKESPACTYCFLFYVEDDGLYEACFDIEGFGFCHTLYRAGERPDWASDLISSV